MSKTKLRCAECLSPLPLRVVRDGEQARLWICPFCGNVYAGILDEEADAVDRCQVHELK